MVRSNLDGTTHMTTSRFGSIAGVILAFAALAAPCAHAADPWLPRFGPYDGYSGSRLGTAIGVNTLSNGEVKRMYIGAPNESYNGMAGAGAVHVYSPSENGWEYARTLYANSPQAGAHFGATLAVDGSHILVGAPDYNSTAGRVEFYIDSNQPANGFTLSFRDGITGGGSQHFGYSLALNSDKAAVGYIPSNDGGCVATYRYNGQTGGHWQSFPDVHGFICGTAGAKLGSSLAIRRTGDLDFLLVAGAPAETRNGAALAGGAYVYVPNPDTVAGGLVEVDNLQAQNPAFLDVFGTSVGIDPSFDYIYVGATGRDNGAGRVGSVTVFRTAVINGYNHLTEVFPGPPATLGGHCGASMAVDRSNSQLVIGCPDSTGTVAGEGTVRLLRKTIFLGEPVWTETLLTFGETPHGADGLGTSVALTGDRVFVGAPKSDTPPGTDNGGWYEFGPTAGFSFSDGFE